MKSPSNSYPPICLGHRTYCVSCAILTGKPISKHISLNLTWLLPKIWRKHKNHFSAWFVSACPLSFAGCLSSDGYSFCSSRERRMKIGVREGTSIVLTFHHHWGYPSIFCQGMWSLHCRRKEEEKSLVVCCKNLIQNAAVLCYAKAITVRKNDRTIFLYNQRSNFCTHTKLQSDLFLWFHFGNEKSGASFFVLIGESYYRQNSLDHSQQETSQGLFLRLNSTYILLRLLRRRSRKARGTCLYPFSPRDIEVL